MNKIKHLPKTVPAKSFEFEVDLEGKLTQERYFGKFKSRIPNLKTQADIAKYNARLNAGFDAVLDPMTKNLHRMVSYLKFTVEEGPDWFFDSEFGYQLYDHDIIEALYFEVLSKEEEWYKSVWGEDALREELPKEEKEEKDEE